MLPIIPLNGYLLTTKEDKMKIVWAVLLIISISSPAAISVFAESFQGVNYDVIGKSNLGSTKSSIEIRLEKK